jgi:hypothetical protein
LLGGVAQGRDPTLQHALVGTQIDERDRTVAQLADDRRDQRSSGSHIPHPPQLVVARTSEVRPTGLKRLLEGDDAAGPGTGGQWDPADQGRAVGVLTRPAAV